MRKSNKSQSEQRKYEILPPQSPLQPSSHGPVRQGQLYRLDEYGRPVPVCERPLEPYDEAYSAHHHEHCHDNHHHHHATEAEPRFYRSVRQELLLRFLTALGRMLAWPIKLVGLLLETIVSALGSVFKIILVILMVPTILFYAYRIYTTSSDTGPHAVGAAAGGAITQTTTGVLSGLSGIFHPAPKPSPTPTPQSQAPDQPKPPLLLQPNALITKVGPKIIADIVEAATQKRDPAATAPSDQNPENGPPQPRKRHNQQAQNQPAVDPDE